MRGKGNRKGAAGNELFAKFWEQYPRKVAKKEAEKAFAKLKADDRLLERILAGLNRAKASQQWRQDGGRFIPYPATWLNQARWEDGEETQAAADAVGPSRSGGKWDGAEY